jgi:hypothetical protein
LQKTPGMPGETAISRITAIARDMFRCVPFAFEICGFYFILKNGEVKRG